MATNGEARRNAHNSRGKINRGISPRKIFRHKCGGRKRAFGRKWNRITKNIHLRSKIEQLSPLLDEQPPLYGSYIYINCEKILSFRYLILFVVMEYHEFNRIIFRIQFSNSFEKFWIVCCLYSFLKSNFNWIISHNNTI